MRNLKYVLLAVLCILFAGIFMACGSDDATLYPFTDDDGSGSFSKASMSGVWLIQVLGDTGHYFISDGFGNITDHSFWTATPFGIYDITGSGLFGIAFQNDTGSEMVFAGALNSTSLGSVTSANGAPFDATVAKVSNTGALAGTLAGTLTQTCSSSALYPQICDTAEYNVILTVGATGAVSTGTISNGTNGFDVSGAGAYAISNSFVVFLITNGTDVAGHEPYALMKVTGDFTGDKLLGVYELDSDVSGPVGVANLTLAP